MTKGVTGLSFIQRVKGWFSSGAPEQASSLEQQSGVADRYSGIQSETPLERYKNTRPPSSLFRESLLQTRSPDVTSRPVDPYLLTEDHPLLSDFPNPCQDLPQLDISALSSYSNRNPVELLLETTDSQFLTRETLLDPHQMTNPFSVVRENIIVNPRGQINDSLGAILVNGVLLRKDSKSGYAMEYFPLPFESCSVHLDDSETTLVPSPPQWIWIARSTLEASEPELGYGRELFLGLIRHGEFVNAKGYLENELERIAFFHCDHIPTLHPILNRIMFGIRIGRNFIQNDKKNHTHTSTPPELIIHNKRCEVVDPLEDLCFIHIRIQESMNKIVMTYPRNVLDFRFYVDPIIINGGREVVPSALILVQEGMKLPNLHVINDKSLSFESTDKTPFRISMDDTALLWLEYTGPSYKRYEFSLIEYDFNGVEQGRASEKDQWDSAIPISPENTTVIRWKTHDGNWTLAIQPQLISRNFPKM